MEYTGRIIKGVGSFYTLLTDNGEFVCKARGRFRKEGITPVPGDYCRFETGDDGKGCITEILTRKNLLIRPAAANIDKLMIVLASSLPRPDYCLADKLIMQCELSDITPVILLNKCDEMDRETYEAALAQYKDTGYDIIPVSARDGTGIDRLKAEIAGSTCCFAGQSAVGKSSLMNALAPGLELPVGGLSDKIDRGRHTTRHAQLWQVCGGCMLDTPGFSLLDMAEIDPAKLCLLYPEMRQHLGNCRFSECLHMTEPDCGVKPFVGNGISPERYERYCKFAEELKEKRKHRYD